jgi:hypothetical protein
MDEWTCAASPLICSFKEGIGSKETPQWRRRRPQGRFQIEILRSVQRLCSGSAALAKSAELNVKHFGASGSGIGHHIRFEEMVNQTRGCPAQRRGEKEPPLA